MKNFLKRPYYYFFTSIFLVIISLLIATIFQNRLSENERSRLGWVDKKFVSVSDSIFVRPYYVIADVFNILKFNFFTRGIDVRNLKIDYQRLKHEFSLLKDENEKLSRIIKYSPTYSKIIATGRILSDPHSFSVSAFSISVGKKDGVEFGDIVTNEHGLVGKIVKVYESISIVLPIRHVSAKTIGRIKEQGSLVLISGRHFKGGVIDYISNNVGLEKNQQILSISDGVSMPAGIPIGTIVNPYERPIQVKLNVDFSLLDYVTIIRNNKTKYNTSEQTDIFEQKSSQKNQDNSQNISGKKNKSINQDQGH